MNKNIILGIIVLLVLMSAADPSEKKAASRKFRQIETSYIDSLNSEKNYKKKEKIDADGNVLESWEWNHKGTLQRHVVSLFSSKMQQRTVYDGLDSMVLIEIVNFDSRGRKTHIYQYDRRKKRREDTEIKFNKWGEKIEEKVSINGRCTQIKKFVYNASGLLISQINSDSIGVVQSIKTISYSK